MLKELYIKNFVLIDELRIDFENGFHAFIGETGAGKSILMDAISLACGERSNSDIVRHGTNKAIIEAVFETNEESQKLLEEYGFEVDDEVILTREIASDGKSVARVNHRSVNLSVLKDLGSLYIDIHSQFDTAQMKLKGSYLNMLDEYMGACDELEAYLESYEKYSSILKEKEEYLNNSLSEDEIDVISFNVKEIQDADIYDGELEEVEEKKKLLEASEAIERTGNECIGIMDGENGVCDQLYEVSRSLKSVRNIEAFESASEKIDSFYYELKDLVSELNSMISSIANEAENYEALNERAFLIRKLIRKHGGSYEAMMHKLDIYKSQLEKYDNSVEYEADLNRREKEALANALKCANELHKKRLVAAKEMETNLAQELCDLELKNASFKIEFKEKELMNDGIDDVIFMVSMNKGEVLRPLLKCASGGELSRFMLGLQVVNKNNYPGKTMIFDEIDSGISGKTAYSIGKKMHELAKTRQVFAVTHLSQVAAASDYLYFISKETKNDLTSSSIKLLENDEIYEKLAIIANGTVSDAAIETAKQMVEEAKKAN